MEVFGYWTNGFHRLLCCHLYCAAGNLAPQKEHHCAFSTWAISDNFSPSSSFGLLSKLGNWSLVLKETCPKASLHQCNSMGELPWTRVACAVHTGRFRELGCVCLEAYFWLLATAGKSCLSVLPSHKRGSCGTVCWHHGPLQRRRVGLYCTSDWAFSLFPNGTWQLGEKQLKPPQLFS